VRCSFAYGPADATATHYLLLQLIQIGFTFLVLPFWYRLTLVIPDKIQKSRETIVCVPVTVACPGGVAIRYVLPVLCVTPLFDIRRRRKIIVQFNPLFF